MGIDRRLRDAGAHLRDRLDGPTPAWRAEEPTPGRTHDRRPVLVVVATVALVAAAVAVAWTRDDGGSVVVTAEPAPATSTATTTPGGHSSASDTTVAAGATTGASSGAAQPSDEAAIEEALRHLLAPTATVDDKLATIDRPDGLREVLERGLDDPRTAAITYEVVHLEFLDPDTADAGLAIFLPGDPPARFDRTLILVRTDGGWKAQRGSWCELVSTGGYACPPDPTATTGAGRIGDPPIGVGSLAATTTLPSPAGTGMAEIVAAVDVLFAATTTVDDKLAVIDRPDGLRDVLERGVADPRQATLVSQVFAVHFASADEAVATLGFSIGTGQPPTEGGSTLTFVRTAAGWQAERNSYCALVATGAEPCPPDPG